MKKRRFLRCKNFKKIITIFTFFLIVLVIISNSTNSITLKMTAKTKNINFKELDRGISDGLAPQNREIPTISYQECNCIEKSQISNDCPIMYGYNAYPGPESIVYFDVCNCDIEIYCELWGGGGDFFSGGTYGCDGVWYACEYGSGVLYGIDLYTCDMWSIGGGGAGLNALAYNPVDNRMYGVDGGDNLYEIDPDTGEQGLIGQLGGGILLTIGMSFDAEGTLYAWDLVEDSLWIIDVEDCSREKVGALGININYAQDGDFHRESDVLYLTAYTNAGALYSVDKTTGCATLVCTLEGGMEITSSIFLNSCEPPEHDVSVKSIDYPESGYAFPEMPMQVTIKNTGNNIETTDVQMRVTKYEPGPIILEEDFSGTFPPDGWETDYWNQNYTNKSGGQSPEAECYKYTQYYQGDYYDNYIQSCPIDCTGFEKVKLRFRWSAEYKYPQYCSVFIKYRNNFTSPWKEITPWKNPISGKQESQLWEINCYSFDNLFDDEFQIKWEYIGYYYYFNYLWLDDIEIIGCNTFEVYNETVEDLEIEKGEELIVEFPTWTPPEWQDPGYENTWQEYKVKACTLLEDDKPKNDCKIELIDIYYPWLHDIKLKSIDSPCEDGPGKTYPVKTTIKNVGQNTECCITINISIGESKEVETVLEESTWPNPYPEVPADGWTDEHKQIANNYGWRKSNSSYSGGTLPEASLLYYYARQDYHFYSYAIDTSNYQILRLRFLTFINHYSGQGLYGLEAGYSTDKETWHIAWHEEPNSDKKYEVDVPIQGGSDTTYIGFWVKGNPYYFNYWYIDDIELVAVGFEEEYSDFVYLSSDINPGEEINFTFEDWTPDFLQYETTGTKEYIIEASFEMESDKNPINDIKAEQFTLDYWHDVGIDRVISPIGEGHPRAGDEELWDNGDPDGRNSLAGSMYLGYSNILIDDFQNMEDWTVQGGDVHFIWNSGYGIGNTETLRIYFYKDEDECDPSFDEYPEPDFYFEEAEFTEYLTGNYYFGRPEVVVNFLLEEEAQIPQGKWFVGIQPDGIAENIAYILTAPDKGCQVMADLPYWGYPRWSSSQYLWGLAYDLCYALHGNPGGPPSPSAWIQPGTEDIDAVVKNYGTFAKENLTCYASIYDYFDDPENGTLKYTDEIGNIDLTIPLGGEKNLQFEDFTFADEGRYGLFLEFPASPDDNEKNNKKSWGIAVDDTKPESDYPPILDPPYPDGFNSWYVSNVSVTLEASDPWSNGVSSGVKEIRYTVNGGEEKILPGNWGSFLLTEDGDDILVEYWAVDWVGNVEATKNSFTIDIDRTVPEISFSYEVTGGNKITGWEFTFTVTATDVTSGMDFVEFYLNGQLQKVLFGPGPDFHWIVKLPDGVKTIIKAIAYDKAGLFESKEIKDPVTSSNYRTIVRDKSNNYQYPFHIFIMRLLERFPLLYKILDVLRINI